MHGTLLFVLGIIGAIASAAVVFLVAGVVLIYQVGKSLS